MPNYICVTCGVQYVETETPPGRCLICEDERQYVNANGQTWTTLAALQQDHHNVLKEEEPGLIGISTEPKFAIGQRALVVQTPEGNVLWDCISFIDEETIEAVQALGGLTAIAVSHPHFYDSAVEWSRAFNNIPVYLHAADKEFVMRPDPVIHHWEGETHPLLPGVTLVRCGGHFPGSSVLHWRDGADGKGALLTADTIQVVADRRYATFLYSYPNQIPLNAAAIHGIVKSVEPFIFDRIYGGWYGAVIKQDAKAAVRRSADRYIKAIAP